MQRNAPARGAVGTRSVVVSAGSVASGARGAGKSDPSRGRDTRAGDRDDRGGLRGCADGVGARRDIDARRAAVRHAGEQYAWPRSHDAQIAKRRLQRRQIFWRSGASTTSERRRASTGHGAQTVAQERRLARSVGASRRSPRVWRDQLQALTSSAARLSLPTAARSPTEEAVDAAAPVDAQNASTAAWKSRSEREIPTAPTALFFFFEKTKTKNPTTTAVQIYAVSGER